MVKRKGDPLCPCGHLVIAHFPSGCLDAQWTDETASPFEDVSCSCELNYEEADLAARVEVRRLRRVARSQR